MSVLVISTPVYNKVATTLCTLNNVRQQDTENPLCVNFLLSHNGINSTQQICRFVALLEAYNNDTAIARKEVLLASPEADQLEATTKQFQDAYEAFQKRTGIHQLYKWLQCITYNIDLEGWGARYMNGTEHERYLHTLKVANDLKHALAGHIVASLPEYNAAQWSTL